MNACRRTDARRVIFTVVRGSSFVLSGELTMELEGEQHRLTAQQGLEIPPGEAHQAQNLCGTGGVLVISHPTTRGDRTEQA